jgi:hypothetical protein
MHVVLLHSNGACRAINVKKKKTVYPLHCTRSTLQTAVVLCLFLHCGQEGRNHSFGEIDPETSTRHGVYYSLS